MLSIAVASRCDGEASVLYESAPNGHETFKPHYDPRRMPRPRYIPMPPPPREPKDEMNAWQTIVVLILMLFVLLLIASAQGGPGNAIHPYYRHDW